MNEYATVDEMIEKLQRLSGAGYGDYVVGCNDEYMLARKEDDGLVYHERKEVDFGGYT